MGHIRIPGDPRTTKTAQMHRAVAAEFARLEEERKPKPKKQAPKKFTHIRDWRDARQ